MRKSPSINLIPIFASALLVALVGFMPIPTVIGQNGAATPEFISAEQLKQKLAGDQEGITVIDVRDTKTYISSPRIKGSLYFKLRRLPYRLTLPPLRDLPRDREVVTYCACAHDEASIRAARILLDAGFKHVRVLQGGWQMWLKVDGPTEPRPRA